MRVLDTLGIHVDDGGEAGAPHRGGRGREQRGGPGGERTRAVGLADAGRGGGPAA